ncbi:unnamed protein product [Parnassius apollo]|uniref:(apollo) hypothetical protein n=1 Tax=Parnassius apollo TaxID=110799 RepID=A0A8S3W2H8_PARAO|nr:unnamed protein product [Parnassius apollo]
MRSLLSSHRREKGKEKNPRGLEKESIQRSVSKNNATEATQHEFTPPAPPNEHGLQEAKRSRRDENNVLTDVVGILKTTAQKLDSSSSIPDLTKSFISFIGAKMSNYSSQTRTSVEHAIFEIIMKADRGYYESWQHQPNAYYTEPYSNRPSTSVTYGYTSAENVDAANYSINQQPFGFGRSLHKNHSTVL